MPSLSEILRSKTESNQQRTENRRAEREQLSEKRDSSLMTITMNPDLYTRYVDADLRYQAEIALFNAIAGFQFREPPSDFVV